MFNIIIWFNFACKTYNSEATNMLNEDKYDRWFENARLTDVREQMKTAEKMLAKYPCLRNISSISTAHPCHISVILKLAYIHFVLFCLHSVTTVSNKLHSRISHTI